MKQSELVAALSVAAGINKSQAECTLKALGDIASAQLAAGDDVTLPGIGKLFVTQRAAREGRNPATGEAIKIAARKAPKFSAAKAFKDALNPAPKAKAAKKK